MVRILNFFCFALSALACLALYHVSEQTRVANAELRHVNHRIAQERDALSVLQAEWARVADPARIQRLAQAELGLTDTPTVELSSLELLPRRGQAAPLGDSAYPQCQRDRPGQARGSAHPSRRHSSRKLTSMDAARSPTVVQRRIAVAAAHLRHGLRAGECAPGRCHAAQGPRLRIALSRPRRTPWPRRADLLDRNGELLARDLPVHDLYAQPAALWDKDQAARQLARRNRGEPRPAASHLRHQASLCARRPADLAACAGSCDAPGSAGPGIRARLTSATIPRGARRCRSSAPPILMATGFPASNWGSTSVCARASPGMASGSPSTCACNMRWPRKWRRAARSFGARAAGGIVMNVNTGEVIGMVSLPDGQNGMPERGADPRRNRMAQDVYELGSVFKIFPSRWRWKITPSSSTNRSRSAAATRSAATRSTTPKSCRPPVGARRAGGILQYRHCPDRAALGRRAPEGVPAEDWACLSAVEFPVCPSAPRPLYPGQLGRHRNRHHRLRPGHFGHAACPLRARPPKWSMAGAASRPTFLRHPEDRARRAADLARETSETMRELLRYVVTDGTGKKADVPGYDVGGKTGSAQVPGPNGRYMRGKLLDLVLRDFPGRQSALSGVCHAGRAAWHQEDLRHRAGGIYRCAAGGPRHRAHRPDAGPGAGAGPDRPPKRTP